jgi:four helix bundle protein
MRFVLYDVGVECVRSLREPVERVRLHDPNLADQLRRAASSMVLNIAEGRWRAGKDRSNRFRIAAGSASEVQACLELAHAWGLLPTDVLSKPLEMTDRVLAMTWRVLNPRTQPHLTPPATFAGNRHNCGFLSGSGRDSDSPSEPQGLPHPDLTEPE